VCVHPLQCRIVVRHHACDIIAGNGRRDDAQGVVVKGIATYLWCQGAVEGCARTCIHRESSSRISSSSSNSMQWWSVCCDRGPLYTV
jgi:hypothetical protein